MSLLEPQDNAYAAQTCHRVVGKEGWSRCSHHIAGVIRARWDRVGGDGGAARGTGGCDGFEQRKVRLDLSDSGDIGERRERKGYYQKWY